MFAPFLQLLIQYLKRRQMLVPNFVYKRMKGLSLAGSLSLNWCCIHKENLILLLVISAVEGFSF